MTVLPTRPPDHPDGVDDGRAPTAGAVPVLVAQLDRLAASAWSGLSADARSDRAATVFLRVGAGGWTAVAHLVAAERSLVRAGRALTAGGPRPTVPVSSEAPELTAPPTPLLQLTWTCRTARRLARELAGTAPGAPGDTGAQLADVARWIDDAEGHVAAARAAVAVAHGFDGTAP